MYAVGLLIILLGIIIIIIIKVFLESDHKE